MSFTYREVTVAKGRTVEDGKEWRRVYYSILIDTSELRDMKDVEKARQQAEAVLDTWLREMHDPQKQAHTQIPHIPDISALENCDWQPFKDPRMKAGRWIKNPVQFTSIQKPPNVLLELHKVLVKAPNHQIQLGTHIYKFSGDKNQFFHKWPAKKETAK